MDKDQLAQVFSRQKSDSEIFHDLMPFRAREILLVATIFDAFTLEQDGLISEMIFAEFFQMNLFNAPRITSVSSDEEALEEVGKRHFDLVFVVSRVGRSESADLCREIKTLRPLLPVLLLLNDNAAIGEVCRNDDFTDCFDKVFVWNGNSEIFLVMTKLYEDRWNAANDTRT